MESLKTRAVGDKHGFLANANGKFKEVAVTLELNEGTVATIS